ncbi:MAG: tetratricopeptide repeat protein [Cyanobacteria bacterium NC_groundwater_1444_Ag_S-0.65um_54_12]|nr:tetratricopeptide repeat protein [Cyanobacteria bacterium NC_groundwater_1444_Ag_S-0.65um_54_12]
MTALCQQCGEQISAACRFCPGCGIPLGALCLSCGNTVAPGLPFCRRCQEISREPDGTMTSMAGERRIATLLVALFDNFHSLASANDPEDLGHLLADYLAVLLAPLYKYGGATEHSPFDRVIVRFGAPFANEDDPSRAVRAAWEMVQVSKELPRHLQRPAEPLILRIGIATSLVIAGELAGTASGGYAIFGKAVQLAQGLAEIAEPGQILLSGSTQAALRSGFECESLQLADGKSAYILKKLVSTAQPPDGPLQGVTGELLRMEGALSNAQEGRPQLLILVGDAGLGKSRLARAASQIWRARFGGRVMIGQTAATDEQPAALISTLLANWLGAGEPGISKLEQRLAEVFPQDQEMARRLLVPFLGGENHSAADSLQPENRRIAQFQLLSELLIHSATSECLLLILEDLQWSDEPARHWLQYFLRSIAGRRDLHLAVFCTVRTQGESLVPLAEDLDLTRIQLVELSAQATQSHIHALLGERPTSSPDLLELSRWLFAKSEGNPLILEEMLRALVDSGKLQRVAGTWSWHDRQPIDLPANITSLIASRLDRLPPRARQIAQVASVIGRRFELTLLAQVAGSTELEDALEYLCQARIISSDDDRINYVFQQEIIREVAYQGLLLRTRHKLHRRIARALPEREISTIAYHWSKSGEAELSAQAYYRAGEAASKAFSNGEAQRYFLAALEWQAKAANIDRAFEAAVLLGLARAEVNLGNYAKALEQLARYTTLAAPNTGMWLVRGEVLERKGDFPDALRAYREAFDLAGGDPLALARSAARMGSVLLRLGQYRDAIALAQSSLAYLEGLDQPSDEAFISSVLGMCFHRTGKWEAALRAHTRSLDLRQRVGDISGVARSHNNIGNVATIMGSWREAQQHYTCSLALFRKIGDRSYLVMTLNNLGNLLVAQGNEQLAERHFQEALRLARQLGDAMGVATALGNLGESQLVCGNAKAALSYLDECLVMVSNMSHQEYLSEIHCARGRALMKLEQHAAARAELELARQQAEATGYHAFMGVVDRTLAELEFSQDRPDQAIQLARAAEATLRPSASRLEIGRALLTLSQLVSPDESTALRSEAQAIFESLGAKRDLEQVRTLSAYEGVKA